MRGLDTILRRQEVAGASGAMCCFWSAQLCFVAQFKTLTTGKSHRICHLVTRGPISQEEEKGFEILEQESSAGGAEDAERDSAHGTRGWNPIRAGWR